MTLIELMVVVTIISILLMIAIPAYFFYSTRAKVTEGVSLANPALQAANETFRVKGGWPGNNSDAGLPQPASFSSKYVRSIAVSNAGGTDPRITITYVGPNLRGFITDPTIIFQPDTIEGATRWNCTAGDMPNIYRPARCRP
jgi:type IV pilus assembly protein PilA